MKVAVIGAKGLPAIQGGIEYYCQEIYPEIAEQDFQIDLYARRSYTGAKSLETNYRKVRVINLPCVTDGGIGAMLNAFVASLMCLFGNYDVVHFHALGPAFFSFIPRYLSSAKVIVTCHGLDWQRAKWNQFSKIFLQSGERIAVHCGHQLVVVSPPLRDYFRKQYNVRVCMLPTAPATYCDSDPGFRYVRSLGLTVGKYILFLGRLVPEKRPDLLFDAYKSLPIGDFLDYKLVFVGGTSDTNTFTDTLQTQARKDSRVVFTGELTGAGLAEIVRGAGLFVLPSDLEGFPLVLLEAMREGVPVVTSDIPPHQVIVGADRGRLFQAGDVTSCAYQIKEAITQPQESASMAQRAQTYVRNNYHWTKIIKETVQLYKSEKKSSSSRSVPMYSNRL